MKAMRYFLGALMAATSLLTCAQTLTPEATTKTTGMSPVYTDGKCQFRLKLVGREGYSDGGYMFYSSKTNPNGWGFSFGCEFNKSPEEINTNLDAKKVNGVWVSAYQDEPFQKRQHALIREFRGKNWTARTVEYDDLYGMPDINIRLFRFCLIQNNGPQALCGRYEGHSTTNGLRKYNHVRNKILGVLKTIEFVDVPADDKPSSSSPAPAN